MDTPAGWYSDPEQVDTLRYWDGIQWTGNRAPKQKENEAVVGVLVGLAGCLILLMVVGILVAGLS